MEKYEPCIQVYTCTIKLCKMLTSSAIKIEAPVIGKDDDTKSAVKQNVQR